MILPAISVGRRLRLIFLAVAVLFPNTSRSHAAEVVNIAAYGRYGNNQTAGANWLYDFYDGNSKRDVRMTMSKPECKVKMATGPDRIASRILEESGSLVDGRFHDLESIYEYWETSGKCVYLGSDKVKRDGTVTPQERLDRGMVIPSRLRVGQTVSSTAGYYESGEFLGNITYSVKLLDRKPLVVAAGTFPNCIHLRISVQAGEIKQVADEWWAKGVGMIRRRGRDGNPEYYDLVAYNLKGDHVCVPGQFKVESSLNLIRSSARSDSDLKMVFPLAAAGSYSEESVTISNIGDGPLQFYSENDYDDAGSYPAFDMTSLPLSRKLLPGEQITFEIAFRPPPWPSETNQKYAHQIHISGDGRVGELSESYHFTIDLRGSSYFR
jgi:hypothetical protein